MSDDDYLCMATPEGERLFSELADAFMEKSTESFVMKQIQGTGLEYIGQGDSRIVLMDQTGKYLQEDNACVVKISKREDPFQNRSEAVAHENAPDEVKEWLMPITDRADNYDWVVMPYVDTDVTKEMMYEMEKGLLEQGLNAKDVAPRNAARLQDRAVLIDYGGGFEEVSFVEMSFEERDHLKKWRWGLLD